MNIRENPLYFDDLREAIRRATESTDYRMFLDDYDCDGIEDFLLNGLGCDAAKFLDATMQLGLAEVLKGFYKYPEWYVEMNRYLFPLLYEHTRLSSSAIAHLISSSWYGSATFNDRHMKLFEWAEQMGLKKMIDKLGDEQEIAHAESELEKENAQLKQKLIEAQERIIRLMEEK